MPHSLRKSLTAWLQLPALPPTPRKNRRPSRSRSAFSSVASFSIAARSICWATLTTSWKYVWTCIADPAEEKAAIIRASLTEKRQGRHAERDQRGRDAARRRHALLQQQHADQ